VCLLKTHSLIPARKLIKNEASSSLAGDDEAFFETTTSITRSAEDAISGSPHLSAKHDGGSTIKEQVHEPP
jgi:hypothetical protein